MGSPNVALIIGQLFDNRVLSLVGIGEMIMLMFTLRMSKLTCMFEYFLLLIITHSRSGASAKYVQEEVVIWSFQMLTLIESMKKKRLSRWTLPNRRS